MKFSWPFYVAVSLIGILSFFAGKWLPTEFLQNLSGVPMVGALAAALFQLIRDQLKYEDDVRLQSNQQHFDVGITSHMANIAFDRHVEFCEEYIKALQDGMTEMWGNGPSPQCLTFQNQLANIRLSYRTWIVFDDESPVMKFEQALRNVGGIAVLHKEMESGEGRTKKINEMYDIFGQITEMPRQASDTTIAAGRIIDYLQDSLGAKELGQLRSVLIKDAIRNLKQ